MVLAKTGSGMDTVCPIEPQRIFASGNERTPVRMNNKQKYGIKINPIDTFNLIYDLINDGKEDRDFYIAMTYEVTNDPSYKPVTMAWIDVTGNCGISYVMPRQGKYTLSNAPMWRSTVTGDLLSATGHVHDGGMMVTLALDGQTICSSPQIYGRRPHYTEGAGAMNPGLTHISDTGSCADFGQIRRGQRLTIRADYDTTRHPLNKMMDGSLQEIMGISQVYIGVP
ncbi:hypothetical protein K402DRAFT_391095 [Aulographum hederae CBS 113979]|uniref:Uncharacterized protein n=1 Tax=Aulographum hederae CBS 113979 TaxID=1176131 RepID=A0A6G1H931_9PEZI|nr:hypothetical protein K402DRAFT_391095 [Aulographum hederae CBS 113979]